MQVDNHQVHYKVASQEGTSGKIASLIDRGVNGSLAGEDVRLIEKTTRTADVSGINDHTIQGVPIAMVAGIVESHLGLSVCSCTNMHITEEERLFTQAYRSSTMAMT